MIKIKISTIYQQLPLLRQTPDGRGKWKNAQFFLNDSCDEYDYWVICEGINNSETVCCDPKNTIFVSWEPPSIKSYNLKFLKQFNSIITCSSSNENHNLNVYTIQQGLPWMIGRKYLEEDKKWSHTYSKDYTELYSINDFQKDKSKVLSVIVSDKNSTRGHDDRLIFVKSLREYFGDQIDIFGRGIRPLSDKWDGLYPYKYTVVLENSVHNHYWTEKLSDALLACTYPFYYGAPNINEYFDERMLTLIDINKPKKSLEIISDQIQNNRFEKVIESLLEAKNKVLNQYNFFELIYSFIEKNLSSVQVTNKQKITLFPEQYFKKSNKSTNIFSSIKSLLKV